ncbi:bifunctional DNA primase/polymerase [Ancylobacter dichloromethanicus]
MLAAALAYAARGWRVFPCDPRAEKPWSKRPLVAADKGEDGKAIEGTGWPKKATTDPATIREWWRRWPNALIGMAPGWAGAFVVDLDPKGESVESVEARLAEALGHPLPSGPRTVTQSGGRHVWFARPEGAHFGNDTTGLKNIDIRCDAGYVILPPSQLANGNTYSWEAAPYEGEAPALPAGLLDLIATRRQRASAGDAAPPLVVGPAPALTSHTPGEEAKRRYARVALDRIVADAAGAPQGHRGTELFAAACQLGRFITAGAISEREALAALQDAADANGLTREDGAARVQREIRRGLDAGRIDASDVVARLDAIAREAGERRRRDFRPEPEGYPEPRGEAVPFPAPHSSDARPDPSSSHMGGSSAAKAGVRGAALPRGRTRCMMS